MPSSELLERRVEEWLCTRYFRHELAIKKRKLAVLLGVTTREIEHAVQALRVAGNPICSSSDGYWWTDSPVELRAARESLRGRLVTQYRTWRGLGKALKQLALKPAAQSTMFGGE